MDNFAAFALGEAARGEPMKVFDWNKAARLIRAHGAKNASAGLESDWEYTGGEILRDGQPVQKDDTYVYLASTWATPEIYLAGDVSACFIMEDAVPAEWGTDYAHIYWPDSARKILNGET